MKVQTNDTTAGTNGKAPMSDIDFDSRLKEIGEHYGAARQGADALRDQELSRLFVECRWTQEKIAGRMGKSQSWVTLQLRFGRFLRIMTSGHNHKLPPVSLTERHFRDGWTAVGKVGKGKTAEMEEDRFARVAEWLEKNNSPIPRGYANIVKRPGIKKAVIKILCDGKRHTVADITERVRESLPEMGTEQVSWAIKSIQKRPPQDMVLTALHSGRSNRYRLMPERTPGAPKARVDPDKAGAMAVDALPLVKECIGILKQPPAGMPISLALDQLGRVQQMLERLLIEEPVA